MKKGEGINRYLLKLFVIIIFLTGCSKKMELPLVSPLTQFPSNVILVIGDGMGLSHISAHLYQSGSTVLENIRHVGFVETYSANNNVTDSSAGATAMASGYKCPNNLVGVTKDSMPVKTIIHYAQEAGMATGLVTTASLLDGTPAAFFASALNRYYHDTIANHLLKSGIDFLVGGGKQYFDNTMDGRVVLLPKFEEQGYFVSDVWQSPIELMNFSKNKKVLYFNGNDGSSLHSIGFDHLAKSTEKAIDYFNSGDRPFFLMVEGAQIDWASHAGNPQELFLRMEAFEIALEKILSFAAEDKNTLVIITADHATGGLALVEGSERENVKLGFTSNGHTGEMVPIFSFGPGARRFRGIMDNTEIFYKIKDLLRL